jgi:acyl-CoA synthetase (NDP forming)
MVTGEMAEQMAADLAEIWRTATKPVQVVWLAAREQTVQARSMLRDQGWPVLDSPQTAMKVFRALTIRPMNATPHPAVTPDQAVLSALDALQGPVVTEGQAAQVLQALGVPQPEQRLLRSAEQAEQAGREMTGPLVMKIQSPAVLHKTERGGVRLGVAADDVARVYDEFIRAFAADDVEAVLVQQQAGLGPELIVGVTNTEPSFPALVTVGIGGIATELYRDTATRLAPVSPTQALEMLLELRAAPLLTGMRGLPGVDLTAAAEAVARLSTLPSALGDRLVELEINPLRLADDGRTTVALDCFLRLADPSGDGPVSPATEPDRKDVTP